MRRSSIIALIAAPLSPLWIVACTVAEKRLAHGDAGDDHLHGPGGFDSAGLLMGADDLQPVDGRHALTLPDLGLDRLGIGGPLVGPDELQRRSRTGHDDPRGSAA